MRLRPEQLHEAIQLFSADCLDALKLLPENSIDSCCVDPPYHLASIVKRFSKIGGGDRIIHKEGPYKRHAKGFMQKAWDGGDIAFRPEVWAAVLRVLKPGAFLLSFGGTRTYHRMACAIEDGGFVIYDCIQWLYGTGFPKSKKIADGIGTALKPACEIIALARKPLSEKNTKANFARWGTGGLNINDCVVEANSRPARIIDPKPEANGVVYSGRREAGHGFDGGSKAVGTTNLGRWPANVIHDGSDEVTSAFPNAPGQLFATGEKYGARKSSGIYGDYGPRPEHAPLGDSGSAARFFYAVKANADDRLGSKHPTVKPLDLIRYLVRLITPPGGTVLDCFAGTGTTGEAAWREGMKAILIEKEAEYQADIRKRIRIMQEGGYARDIAKTKPIDSGPFFGEPHADQKRPLAAKAGNSRPRPGRP